MFCFLSACCKIIAYGMFVGLIIGFGDNFMEGMDTDEESLVEEGGGGRNGEATEAEMEKMLLQNLSSCDEGNESQSEAEKPPKKKGRR